MVPGRALQRLSKFLLPSRVCDRIIDAQLADFQHEWTSAHTLPSQIFVLIRGYAAFLWNCILCVASTMERGTVEAGDRRALVRVMAISILATMAMLTLLSLPAFSHNPVPSHASAERIALFQRWRWWLVRALFPSELPLAVPVGLMLGLIVGLGKPRVSTYVKMTVLFVAVACSIASFIVMGWIVPATNMSFRIAAFEANGGAAGGASLQRGANELAITELLQRAQELRQEGETRQALRLLYNYHIRWSLAGATMVLAILGLSVAKRRAAARMGWGIAACVAYYLLWSVGVSLAGDDVIPAAVLAWSPNVVVLALALALRPRRDEALLA